MRNLKRILSLALAAAMLMGMMVMGAGAADIGVTYTDEASITNKEAVAVASAIGVFQGTDGKFMPTANLTRESAAKIITYLVLGKTEADALKTAAAPFKDVAADRWSAGSIAYCVGRGILSGDGTGNFFPETEVTGTQFAKMLLVALGYKSDVESFTGANWEGNVMAAAKRPETKLTLGLNVALTTKITREQAAQMTLNTLRSQTVSYSGGASVPVGNGESVVVGATRNFSGAANLFMGDNYTNLSRSASASAEVKNYGRPSVQWKLGKDNIGKFPVTADVVLEGKKTAAEVSSELGAYLPTGGTLYVDGVVDATAHSTAANIADLTANGRTIEFYENASFAIAQTVVVDTFSATVTKVNTVAKEAQLKFVAGTMGGIAGPSGITTLTVTSTANKAIYEKLVELGKDAVLNVTFAGGYTETDIATVAEAETVVGAYTKKNADGTYLFGGESYKMSVHANTSALSLGTEYTLYLDTMGNVITFDGTTTASAAKYGYIANTDVVGSASTTDGLTYKVLMVYSDGTQEWVKVTKVTNAVGTNVTNTVLNKATFGSYRPTNVKYVVKGTSVEITELTDGGTLTAGTIPSSSITVDRTFDFSGATITKNVVNFLNKGTNIKGSASTVFLVENSVNHTFTAYTGVKNIPGWTGATGYVVVPKNDAGNNLTANLVVITTSTAATAKDLVYIVDGSSYAVSYDSTNEVTVYTYAAIKDGEKIELNTTTYQDDASAGLATGLYELTGYNGDYVSGLKIPTADDGVSGGTDNTKVAMVNGSGVSISGGTINGIYVSADAIRITAIKGTNFAVSTELTAADVEYYDTDGTQARKVALLKDSAGFITDIIFVY